MLTLDKALDHARACGLAGVCAFVRVIDIVNI